MSLPIYINYFLAGHGFCHLLVAEVDFFKKRSVDDNKGMIHCPACKELNKNYKGT